MAEAFNIGSFHLDFFYLNGAFISCCRFHWKCPEISYCISGVMAIRFLNHEQVNLNNAAIRG
jgi:hypothetical protein